MKVTVRREVTQTGKILEVALKGLQNKVAKVGWFPSAKYPDGTPVAYVATIQEYGYPPDNIPSRSFMRSTIIEQEKAWTALAAAGARAILRGTATVDLVLNGIGEKAAGDIRKKISSIWSPPLSPVTIQNRLRRYSDKATIGSLTKPLIDTGVMLNTISVEVGTE